MRRSMLSWNGESGRWRGAAGRRRPIGAGAHVVFALVALALGCDAPAPPDATPRIGDLMAPSEPAAIPAPLPEALCEVVVDGVGVLDMETEYLPNVVFCENGGADLEALKVQAIAARATAYHTMLTHGSICDSQDCQVYSCEGTPGALHIQAVEETSGMYLAYGGNLTYGFYVAGDHNPPPLSCVGAPGSHDTEHFVTYNEGLVGTAVEQTTLGFVFPTADPGYGQNRGCMAQWGSRCLEDNLGYDHDDILRFYYGEDIEVLTAQGECILDPDPGPDGGSTGGDAADDGNASAGDDDDGTGDASATDGPPPDDDDDDDDDDRGGDDDDDDGADSDNASEADGADPGDAGDGDTPGTGGGSGSGESLPNGLGQGDATGGCGCVATGRPSKAPLPLMLTVLALGAIRRRRDAR